MVSSGLVPRAAADVNNVYIFIHLSGYGTFYDSSVKQT